MPANLTPEYKAAEAAFRNGADVALAEGTGESFLAHVGKKFESPSEAQEKGIALFQQLLSRGASLQAKDDRHVPKDRAVVLLRIQ